MFKRVSFYTGVLKMKKITAFLLAALVAGALFAAGTGSLYAAQEEDAQGEEMREETGEDEKMDTEDYRRYLEEEMHSPDNAGEHDNIPEDTEEEKYDYPDERYQDDRG